MSFQRLVNEGPASPHEIRKNNNKKIQIIQGAEAHTPLTSHSKTIQRVSKGHPKDIQHFGKYL